MVLTAALVVLVAAVFVTLIQRAGAASATPVVYVATGENFPDGLASGPPAALAKGPILLVRQNSIPSATATELRRLAPDKIIIVGGPAVVSQQVENDLAAFAATVERVAGSDRYATAALLSQMTFPVTFDADTLNGKPSSGFAGSDQACPSGQVMTGIDATGNVVCEPGGSGATTGAVSCWGTGFYPEGSATGWTTDGGQLRTAAPPSADRAETFYCAVQLPDGATITKFKASVNDGSTTASIEFCSLHRVELTGTTWTDVATTEGTLGPGDEDTPTPGDVVLEADPAAFLAQVDNSLYAYRMSCFLVGEFPTASDFGIRGGIVEYTMP
jgi:hypothetical protein